MKYAILIFLLLFLIACVEDPTDPNNPNNNMPIIINTTNTYTYTIQAEDYSHELTDYLSFNSDSIEVYITLGNYSSGSGNIRIESDSLIIFVDSLNSNRTFIKTGIVVDVPNRADIKFEEFSGDLSMVIKAAGN